jgi:hypothetical protein
LLFDAFTLFPFLRAQRAKFCWERGLRAAPRKKDFGEAGLRPELERALMRVLRGGSWINDDPHNLLASYRNNDHPDNRDNNVGFRVVCASGSARKVALIYTLFPAYPVGCQIRRNAETWRGLGRNQTFLDCGGRAQRHAALAGVTAIRKRCRRCALPPQSKIFTERGGSALSFLLASGLIRVHPCPSVFKLSKPV